MINIPQIVIIIIIIITMNFFPKMTKKMLHINYVVRGYYEILERIGENIWDINSRYLCATIFDSTTKEYAEQGAKHEREWKNNLKEGIGKMTFGTEGEYSIHFVPG